jgi:hypothetical protein
MSKIFWIVIIAQAFICAGFCAFIAQEKSRSVGGWFANGFFFSLFALIAVAGVPPLLLEKRDFFGDRVKQ